MTRLLSRHSILLLGLALSASTGQAANEGPRIGGKYQVHDFGAVVKGAKLAHTYTYLNRGNEPLIIESVTAPCPCFQATFDKTILPGQQGNIRVLVDTSSLEGPFFFSGEIKTNEKQKPVTNFAMRGLAKGEITFLPKSRIAMTTMHGVEKVDTLIVEINRPSPLTIKSVSSTNPLFTARHETVSPGKKYRLIVRSKGSAPVGRHKGQIEILTDDAKNPKLVVDVSALVQSSVVVQPGTLYIPRITEGEMKKGVTKSWTVDLKSTRSHPFHVLSATSASPYLRVSHDGAKARQSQEIRVQLAPDAQFPLGTTPVDITVQTNLPDAQALRVPVMVTIVGDPAK